ncbi:DNA primase [Sphingomonas suaedae]|uniref:DNA primase n=1 Tax=Sphingomonas suaedae TaxID=2599297 RepID=A0A518RJZ5_9SPHN|nr:DNA primase [Sphingomonas suaedae]QDX27750.1 DNA primase [Sphingomonas suaedae]
MGGHQVPGQGTGDDGYDEDGYDESQRAEILEATGGGPSNGVLLTDLDPDLGQEIDEEDDEDDVLGLADEPTEEEIGDPDEDVDAEEDAAQTEFDSSTIDEDGLDDSTSTALSP